MAAQSGTTDLQRGLYTGGVGKILCAFGRRADGLLAESAGHSTAIGAATGREASAGQLPPATGGSRRHNHSGRLESLVVSVALDITDVGRILSDGGLVGPGAGFVWSRNGCARAGLSL